MEARKRDAIAAQNAGSMEGVHIPSIPKDEATIRFFGMKFQIVSFIFCCRSEESF